MAHDAWRAGSWRDRLRVLGSRTGWRPADVAQRFPKPGFTLARSRYAPGAPGRVQRYALVQFALLLGAAVHFLEVQAHAPTPVIVGYFAWIVASLTTLGVLLEARRAGAWLEAVRAALTSAGVVATQAWFGLPELDGATAGAAAAGWAAAAAWAAWLAGRSAIHERSMSDPA